MRFSIKLSFGRARKAIASLNEQAVQAGAKVDALEEKLEDNRKTLETLAAAVDRLSEILERLKPKP